MSDQMPDEVWLDGFENKRFWFAFPHPEDDSEPHMRYIRADLYEQAEAERDDARARVEHLLTEICGGAANRHALAEHCREVTAERERLRADIEAALTMGISSDSYALIVDIRRRLREALDHE